METLQGNACVHAPVKKKSNFKFYFFLSAFLQYLCAIPFKRKLDSEKRANPAPCGLSLP
jgi:hypothetical protein